MSVAFTDNSDEVLEEFEEAVLRALEECGLLAERYAKELVQSPGKTGTGVLRNSITHKVDPDEKAAYVGTNVEYAVYQEMGTGIYADGGRPTPWVYQDAKGNWHTTHGNPAVPFIKPSVADHQQEYKNIIEDALKNG